MKIKAVVLVAIAAAVLAAVPTAAYASCSVAAGQAAPLARVVEEELTRLAPWRPGSDQRDVAWLKDNLVELVPEWLPNTRRVAEEDRPRLERIVDDCYRSADYSVPGPVRSEAAACAKEALARLAPSRLADWSAVCGEVRESVQDPSTEERVRAWTREWVDEYIRDARTR